MAKDKKEEERIEVPVELSTVDVPKVETRVNVAPPVVAPDDERTTLWKEYIANYQKKNPVKFASKQANHEFDVPPVSFQGKKRVKKLATGEVRVEIY